MGDYWSGDKAKPGDPDPTEIPLPAPVPIEEPDLESLALGNHPRFMAIIEEARAQCRQGLGLSPEDVRRELSLN